MDIKMSFLGAAQNVTGSRHLIEINGTKILVDCGIYQERDFRHRNWDPFPVPPKDIDVMLLTHAHLDHCGLIPKLVRDGFKGRIFCNEATAEIAKIVMLDSAHIQEEDAKYKIKRHKKSGHKPPRPVKPLYTQEDVLQVFPLFAPVRYKQQVQLADGITASFHEAGHILGASMIKITASFDGETRTVLCSGDIGRGDRPILNDPSVFEQADYVLIESTYGDRVHASYIGVKDKFCQVINDTIKAGGNLIIPSFSVERAQEILYYVNELVIEKKIPRLKAFLDSPMAVKVTRVFKDHPELFDEEMAEMIENHNSPFEFRGLKMTEKTADSKAINHIKGPVLVIAGSGMCTGGRIKHHLANNIEGAENTILFVGYQAFGTLGRRLVNGENPVRILGRERAVNARIAKVNGFSGHADKNELLAWLENLKTPPKHVFVVHGEKEAAKIFSNFVREKTGWDVTVPEYNQTIIAE
ncbi:MAG: MBL fold metallo-hydrolase [Planctomycetes bacterium]|nr:MBL fold metallo-hydrolase [Planctomycetota bacterium]